MSKKSGSFSKNIDTFLGVPFLFALTGLAGTRNAQLPPNILRGAFLSLGSARNIVLSEFAIRAFKKHYPNAEVVLFVDKYNHEADNTLSCIDEIVLLDSDNIRKNIRIKKCN